MISIEAQELTDVQVEEMIIEVAGSLKCLSPKCLSPLQSVVDCMTLWGQFSRDRITSIERKDNIYRVLVKLGDMGDVYVRSDDMCTALCAAMYNAKMKERFNEL